MDFRERLKHSAEVALQAVENMQSTPYYRGCSEEEQESIVNAVYAMGLLHDIGYARDAKNHAEISATMIRDFEKYSENCIDAIRNHGKCTERMSPFDYALNKADMTVTAAGSVVTMSDRLKDIKSRYGEGTVYENAVAQVESLEEYENKEALEHWYSVKQCLPETGEVVKVLLINGVESTDYVNAPFDETCPFRHFLVKKWRYLTPEEKEKMGCAINEPSISELCLEAVSRHAKKYYSVDSNALSFINTCVEFWVKKIGAQKTMELIDSDFAQFYKGAY